LDRFARQEAVHKTLQGVCTGAPVFVPAGHPASLLEEADFPAASKAYDREIENKSACVHDLDKFGSLDSLKEAAFLYCYSKEPWAELDFS